MLVQSELNKLSDSARVWIYQSNREFTDSESQEIREAASQFVQSWKAHEVQLLAAAEVLYNRFIVLSVDENIAGASGCSIDKSVKFIREIEQKYNCNLFDRLSFAVKNNEKIELFNAQAFKEKFKSGEINLETIVFNNLVSNLKELKESWEVPISISWHKQFLN